MTPTEQDKELREKVATIVEYWDFSPLQDEDSRIERLKDEIMQLITADRKRVALEARISELKMWELPENEIQMVFANPCNICGHDYPKLKKAQQDRLSALKAQQEET